MTTTMKGWKRNTAVLGKEGKTDTIVMVAGTMERPKDVAHEPGAWHCFRNLRVAREREENPQQIWRQARSWHKWEIEVCKRADPIHQRRPLNSGKLFTRGVNRFSYTRFQRITVDIEELT